MALTVTTIKVSGKVKARLDKLKNYGRETYNDVIQRLMNIVDNDEPLNDNELKQIVASLEDVRKGRVMTLEEAEKKWGL